MAVEKKSDILFQYEQFTRRKLFIILVMIVGCVAIAICNVVIGAYDMTLGDLLYTLVHPSNTENMFHVIVWVIRMPPAVAGILAGSALGLAGATMQTILHNPLASPYTLGVSAGAGVGASMAIILGVSSFSFLGSYLMPTFAFIFALLACTGIYFFAKIKNFTSVVMVLAGIGMNFLFQAVQMFMQYIASAEELQSAMFWLFGSLHRTDWNNLAILFAVFVICFILIYVNSWKLTAMQLGDDKARALGIRVEKIRMLMFILISLVTATAVAFVGTIGFIGIVGPHIARMLVGEDQRFFIPMSCASGAFILSAAGLASKVVVPGTLFPVGILTALLGVPFFFLLILTRKRGERVA
jgi:iron complex transport system permease protein